MKVRAHRSTRRLLAAVASSCALVALVAVATEPARSASSSVVVTMDVPSATTLVTTGCQDAGTPGVLAIGTVLPGTAARTPVCSVTFGSSNDTSALRLFQSDGLGSAMWAYGDGDLATGWATGGIHAPVIANSQDYSIGVAAPDGDTIIGGRQQGSWRPFLQRVDASGALDPNFDGPGSGNGHVTYGGGAGPAVADLAMQGDDIIVASSDIGTSTVIIFRVDGATGIRDTSFAGTGFATVDVPAMSESVMGVTVLDDGRIVAVGSARDTGEDAYHTSAQVLIARFLPDGQPDTSFGTGGYVLDDIDPTTGDTGNMSIVDEAGRIYVTASDGNMCSAQAARLVRYLPDGSRDTANFRSPFGWRCGVGGGWEIEFANDGKVLMASNDARMIKVDLDGTLDTSFGTSGTANPPVTGNFTSQELADGSILRAGTSGGGSPRVRAFLTDANGQLDTTWGSSGVVDVDLAAGGVWEMAHSIVPGVDGRLALVGELQTAGNYESFTIMLERSGVIDDYGVSDWTPSATTSAFGVCMQAATSASTTWTTNATCPQTDGAYWRAVAQDATVGASLAATTLTGEDAASIDLRFGVRAGDNAAPGSYVAPVTFELVAPSA